MHKLESDLNQLYADFFKKCEIDEETGIVKSNPYKRFATKVAIGENYLNSEKKILFVSLDMGRDENLVDFNKNTFQDFQQRRDSVCSGGNLGDKNPHMAGVYGTALYFLKDHYNWEVSWKLLVEKNQFFREILIANNGILPQNVLKHIALLNFYNFVTVGRKDRTGGSDRKLVFEKDEINLLIQTINTLKPDVIIVQSKTLVNYFKNLIKPNIPKNTDIYIGFHPSVFGRGIKNRIPKNYVNNLITSGKI